MSALAAVVRIGERPQIGSGAIPAVEAHLYAGTVPRFVAFRVTDGPELERVSGAYAPAFDREPPYPVTDILLAFEVARALSAISQRLNTLSTKAEANYDRSFREMVFATAVEWGSDGYGRLFEARSQLEAHPFEGVVEATVTPAATEDQRAALVANLDRIDGTTRVYEPV